MQQLGLDIIADGLLHQFEVDHVDMLIPGPVKIGDGVMYFKSPYEDYTLRGTWRNGKLSGRANLCFEKTYVVADISFWEGVVDGLCIVYDFDNRVVFHGFLYNGSRDGICIDIDPETTHRNYARYRDGVVVSVIKPLPFHCHIFAEVSTSGKLLNVGCFNEDFSDYEGLFICYESNLPTELSILKDEKKTVLKQFKDNQLVEYDAYQNITYEGEFIQNVKYLYPRHGKGNEYEEGRVLVYSGDFANGYRHGQGILYENGKKRYEGGWKLGEASGQGVLFDEQGNEVFRGNFLKGYIVVKEGEPCNLPEVRAVFSSQYALPKVPQLSTILLGLSEQELKETRLEADPANWWLDDAFGVVTPQPFEITTKPSPDPLNPAILLEPKKKNGCVFWYVATLTALVLGGLCFCLFVFFGGHFVVSACDGELWNPTRVRSITFAAGVCAQPRDVVIEGCPWLTSVVFEKGAFRGGGCVTVASNPRLASLVFEEETFLTGGELNVRDNRELSELTFGTHAFAASSSLLLQENTKLRTVFFGDSSFRYAPSCSFVQNKFLQSIHFGKESFYSARAAAFESAFSDRR